MHRIAYLFPLLTIGLLVILFRNYDQWWMYLIMAVVSELVLWLIMRRVSRTKEYLSGYALNVQHHEPWVERVERLETYTDRRGNTRTRRVVDYRRHPDVWVMPLNTGIGTYISPEVYNHYRAKWRTPEHWINPPHYNCVSGGGGQLYEWNGVYEDAATHTYKGLYVNYIANSNSIFRKERLIKEDIKRYGLIDYPKIEKQYLEQEVVLRSPKLPEWVQFSPKSQRAFQLINAFAGNKHQIHIFVLVFDAAQGITTAFKQQAYWKGGNKNEFVVCLGVDFSQIDPQKSVSENPHPTIKWCKAFSWCDVPQLESATESYFIENKELNLLAYAKWLREHIGLWKRKEFKDFQYLGVRLSSGRKAIVAAVTTLFCAVIIVITCVVAVDNRRYNYGNKRDCSGYGYVLLDTYYFPNTYK